MTLHRAKSASQSKFQGGWLIGWWVGDELSQIMLLIAWMHILSPIGHQSFKVGHQALKIPLFQADMWHSIFLLQKKDDFNDKQLYGPESTQG